MRFLSCPDIHLTEKRPQNRTDDYEATVLRKFRFILDTADENNCDVILQPGDLFDNPKPSYAFYSQIVSHLKGFDFSIFTIFGQHDLKYRNPEDTALWTLNISIDDLIVLSQKHDSEPIIFSGKIGIQGCGWEEERPEPFPGKFNILLIHKMIVDDKLWADQEHFEYANGFLRDHKFDLIVSGDNHQSFTKIARGGKTLINCGSMMRSTIAQIDHQPRVIIYDTETRAFENVFIPIEPAEDVFKMNKVETEKERNTNLEAFVSGLSEHKDMGLNFGDNLQAYVIENKLGNEIYELLKRGMA
jgi:DNA repair exonuclease SbcCD nuclease subunit